MGGFVDFYAVRAIKCRLNLRTGAPSVKSRGFPNTFKNAHLLRELVKRDFRTRFTGSALGVAWAVIQPLSLVVLYWFVFTCMFSRGPAAHDDHYIDFLIAGLLPWLGLNEGILRATTCIVDNSAMVRRLAFRSELLVVVPNASAMIFELIALALFSMFLVVRGTPPFWIWLLPVALVLQFAIQVGLGWFLAASFVLFRDLMPIVGFVLSVLFYLSPILYPVAGRFAMFFAWNPMTPLLGLFRSALLSAALPAAGSVVFLVAVAAGLFSGGLWFFRRAQATLADLI